jgi:methionyl-tRNA synthetase
LADVFTRFSRCKQGASAPKPLLLTGTDEHGMKIQKAAESKGMSPRDLCDTVSKRFEVH